MAHPILAAAFVQVSQVSPAEVNSSWLPLLERFLWQGCAGDIWYHQEINFWSLPGRVGHLLWLVL